jgi:hypothetical protein
MKFIFGRSVKGHRPWGNVTLNCIFTKTIKMIIERTPKEVIFRLPSSTKLEDLQDIADLFTFQEISAKSKATQKQVDDLVKKIKKGRWNKTKQKIGL